MNHKLIEFWAAQKNIRIALGCSLYNENALYFMTLNPPAHDLPNYEKLNIEHSKVVTKDWLFW